jgi:hypothetical protein
MKALLIAAALCVVATSAFAQAKEKKELQDKQRAEQDKAYKESIARIPAAKQTVVDPWSTAREPTADAATAKPAKKTPAAKPGQ